MSLFRGYISKIEAIVILDDLPIDFYKIEPEHVDGIIKWWRKRIKDHKYLRKNVQPRSIQIYGSRAEIIEMLKEHNLTEIEQMLKERYLQKQWEEREEKARRRFGTMHRRRGEKK